MKVALTTLGCKLNYAETSTYERGFVAAGLEVVPWNAVADAYVINTCAVTETAEKKSRNLIRRAHKLAPDALVLVTGCYAELKKEKLYAIEGVSRVFGAAEKSLVVPETLSMLSSAKTGVFEREQPESTSSGAKQALFERETLPAYSSGERTRSFLKVQDGCNNFCAYCTVPYARGRSRNIPICELVKQARQIAAKGIREVVLTGVNTGDFGRTTGESFLDLLKALNAVEGIDRYRISSIEPNLITEEIVDWIASGTKFQRHFHIPLQSGSDTLLKKVGRRYDTALFASRIDYIRQAMERPGEPKVFFGIDVIVGLPGETEELFLETYHFLKDRIKPAFLHVFPYSKRPGTRAAVMPDQVQDSLKTERVARLEALSADLHAAFVAANKGLPERVLWESTVKDGLMAGYTGNYIRVEKPYDPAFVNQLEDIVL
jgi:threonylcarbamoyladenosine tRNA methylthiotransferase MtaB